MEANKDRWAIFIFCKQNLFWDNPKNIDKAIIINFEQDTIKFIENNFSTYQGDLSKDSASDHGVEQKSGSCYEYFVKVHWSVYQSELIDLGWPQSFDLLALTKFTVFSFQDKNRNPLDVKKYLIENKMITSFSKEISHQGLFLSDAKRYSKGNEGETLGPSGLKFL